MTAGAVERYEYHWLGGRLVVRKKYRPAGRGPWPCFNDRQSTLVVALEPRPDGFRARRGLVATEERVREALLLHQGVAPWQAADSPSITVPDAVLQAVSQTVQEAADQTALQFAGLSSEDQATDVFFDGLAGELLWEGWQVRITGQNSSRLVEKPVTGSDGGIIVDLLGPSLEREVRVAWFHSKMPRQLPLSISALPDLPQQMGRMAQHTGDAYAVVYAPTGVYLYQHQREDEVLEPGLVVSDMVASRRGDADPRVLLDTLDSRFLLELLITAPQASN